MSLAHVIRTSVAMWLSLHGSIAGKDGEILSRPSLRKLQNDVVEIITYCREHDIPCRIVGLKARQVGLSTICMGAAYHACRVSRTNMLLIGEKFAKSVLNLQQMFWRFAKTDTFNWGHGYDESRRLHAQFDNGSSFRQASANDNRAGSSGTYQWMIITEAAHFKYTENLSPDKLLQSCLACVPPTGFSVTVMESTANGEGNAFHSTYKGAITFAEFKRRHEAGEPTKAWIKIFLAWHQFHEYRMPVSPREVVEIMSTLSERERDLIRKYPHIDTSRIKFRRETILGDMKGNESLFDEEYPEDEDSAFLATGNRVFNQSIVADMMAEADAVEENTSQLARLLIGVLDLQAGPAAKPAWRVTLKDEAWLKVWELPRIGCKYWISGDPATGKAMGEDPDNHSFLVWRAGYYDANKRWWPRRLVARITDVGAEATLWSLKKERRAACRFGIDLLTEYVKAVAAWYGRCPSAVENNADQGMIRDMMKESFPAYVQQKRNRITDKQEDVWGWHTNVQTKGDMVAGMMRLLRARRITDKTEDRFDDGDGVEIFDPYVVQEFKVFGRDPDGSMGAMTNWHDDNVISCCIGDQTANVAAMLKEYKPASISPGERMRRQQMAMAGHEGDRTYS